MQSAAFALFLLFALQLPQTGSRLHEIREWMEAYDAAFRGAAVERLSKFYADDASVIEGSDIATWAEAREHRLLALFRMGDKVDLRRRDSKVHLLDDTGTFAYVVSVIEVHKKDVDHELHSRTTETMTLERRGEMGWRIRHVHRSAALEQP